MIKMRKKRVKVKNNKMIRNNSKTMIFRTIQKKTKKEMIRRISRNYPKKTKN